MTHTEDGTGVSGRITRRTYDSDEIRKKIPFWDDYDRLCEELGETFEDQPNPLNAARLAALEEFGPEPLDEAVDTNVVLDGLLQYIVDHFDSSQSVSAIDASHLAVGTDDTSPTSSNTGLNNEVYRESVDTSNDNGKDLTTETLIGTGEGNGNTFREVGLVSASSGGTFFNHSIVSSEDKTSDKSITYEVELQFRNA